MAILLFNNNASTTLAAPINNSVTTLDVAPGTGALFPAPGANQYFTLTLVDASTGLLNEIMHVTGRTIDTLTVVRGQEGTVARAWNTGDFCNNFWTAGSAAAMLQQGQAQQQATNYAVDTGIADALTIALNPAPTALSGLVGTPIRVLVNITNATANPTLNVNGLGGEPIRVMGPSGAVNVGIGSLLAGEICEFVWDGTQFQYLGRVAGATQSQINTGTDTVNPITSAGLAAAMANDLNTGANTHSYQYLPNGLLMQFGNFTTAASTTNAVSFATAFPNALLSVVAMCATTGSANVSVVVISSTTTSGFNAIAQRWDGAAFNLFIENCQYIAIGY